MPIVGPVNTGSTQTLGCVTSVTTLDHDDSTWWHSTVFATSMSTYSPYGVPDLTTAYTYPAQCVDRWMIPPNAPCGNGPQNFTVFSVDPTRVESVSDPLYRSCQRYSTPIYSPGMCPSGHPKSQMEQKERFGKRVVAEGSTTPMVQACGQSRILTRA
jgi:hypothetical protein